MSYQDKMRAKYAHVLIDRMEKRIAETGELPVPLAETIERVLWGRTFGEGEPSPQQESP